MLRKLYVVEIGVFLVILVGFRWSLSRGSSVRWKQLGRAPSVYDSDHNVGRKSFDSGAMNLDTANTFINLEVLQ